MLSDAPLLPTIREAAAANVPPDLSIAVTPELSLPIPKLWRPKRVLITPAALGFVHGRSVAERAASHGAKIVELKSNRLTGIGNDDPRRVYAEAKSTLAVVVAPPSKRRLQPIPPSADWRFDLAEAALRIANTATWPDH